MNPGVSSISVISVQEQCHLLFDNWQFLQLSCSCSLTQKCWLNLIFWICLENVVCSALVEPLKQRAHDQEILGSTPLKFKYFLPYVRWMSWLMHPWHAWPWIDCQSLMVGRKTSIQTKKRVAIRSAPNPSNVRIPKKSVFWPKSFICYRGNIIDITL